MSFVLTWQLSIKHLESYMLISRQMHQDLVKRFTSMLDRLPSLGDRKVALEAFVLLFVISGAKIQVWILFLDVMSFLKKI